MLLLGKIVYGSIYISISHIWHTKIRGKSTRSALKSAAIIGGGAYGLGKLEEHFQGSAFSSTRFWKRLQ